MIKIKDKHLYIMMLLILMFSMIMFTGLNIKTNKVKAAQNPSAIEKIVEVGDSLSNRLVYFYSGLLRESGVETFNMELELTYYTANTINKGSLSIEFDSEKFNVINKVLDMTYTSVILEDQQAYSVVYPLDYTSIIVDSISVNGVTVNQTQYLYIDIQYLKMPEVVIDWDGLASWTAIENAVNYKYCINGEGVILSTTETSIQLELGQYIYICAGGDNINYRDSYFISSSKYQNQLCSIMLTIDNKGLASWSGGEPGTIGYKYMINDGDEAFTTETSVQLLAGQSITVKAVGDNISYLDSTYSPSTYYSTTLTIPTLSISESGLASWLAIDGATSYNYKIDEGTENNTTALSIQLTNSQSISVKAVGDGNICFDSVYSTPIIYTALVQLNTPQLTISESGLASWTAVENATSYIYKIDNGVEVATTILAVQLSDGNSITVKAVEQGDDYSDSEYSKAVTYTAPLSLVTPTVSISISGLASWTAVENASGYKYKINNGAEVITMVLNVQLTEGQNIIVKAVGNATTFLDSEYSKTLSYTVPTIILEVPEVEISSKGIASWMAIVNASGYKYKIDNGVEIITTAVSVQLTEGQNIIVKAIGNGITYLNSEYSETLSYTVSATTLEVPEVEISTKGIASWTAIENATGYIYKIDNCAEVSTTSLNIELEEGQKIKVKAIGNGTRYLNSEYSISQTFTPSWFAKFTSGINEYLIEHLRWTIIAAIVIAGLILYSIVSKIVSKIKG